MRWHVSPASMRRVLVIAVSVAAQLRGQMSALAHFLLGCIAIVVLPLLLRTVANALLRNTSAVAAAATAAPINLRT